MNFHFNSEKPKDTKLGFVKMADDMDDIEDMLEAPYKNQESTVGSHTNGNGVEHNGNENNHKKRNGKEATDSHSPRKEDQNKAEKMDQSGEAVATAGDDEEKKDDSKSKDGKKNRKDRSRSRDRHKKRSRSRSRSKKSKRDRSKEKSKEKDVEKSKDKDKDRKKRSRSRDKNSKRSRTRSRTRSRSRSRSRSARNRRRSSRDDSRSRRKKYSRSRSRSRSRSHSRNRRSRHSRNRSRSRSRVKSPELTPEERDARTVFCMQLSARIRPRDLEDFFTAVGKVRDVRLITDPRTKRSKGIAYIEFKETDSVPLAIALTGQRLLGVPIIVKLTQAEKNRLPFTGPHIPANLPQDGPIKLYVGSLHVNITEEMLRGIFEPFGSIDAIVLARDDFQRSKGYGFIQFSNAEDGKKAMEQLNNFELASRPIKVSLFISEKSFDTPHAVHVSNLDNDDLDRTGVNLGPSGKLALMAKLAEGTGLKMPQYALDSINMTNVSGTPSPVLPAHFTQNGVAPAAVPTTSQCLLLTNMFDLEEEKKKPNWVEDIKEDIIEECSKYGGIVHLVVDQNLTNGTISMKCSSIAVAMAAMNGLNGRYFAGKMIKASFIPLTSYHMKFPESISRNEVLKPSF